jgi:hypothetical protein
VIGRDAVDWENTAAQLGRVSKEFFEQKCAKINAILRRELGLLAALPHRPPRPALAQCHGLDIAPDKILIE